MDIGKRTGFLFHWEMNANGWKKEQYIHEQHLAENKRQNLVKKACLFIVMGIMPYIDRIINETHKLTVNNYIDNEDIKKKQISLYR